jgi:hypothetical protein
VDPSKYGEELVNGGARSAQQLMLNSQRYLSKGMTLDGCAMVTAIMKLSQGNPNAIISRGELETEVSRLKTPGSAFLRAMSDPASRGKYGQLAADGKVATLGKSIIQDAKAHSVRSAQWQIRQSQSELSAQMQTQQANLREFTDYMTQVLSRMTRLTEMNSQTVSNFQARAERLSQAEMGEGNALTQQQLDRVIGLLEAQDRRASMMEEDYDGRRGDAPRRRGFFSR